MTTLPVPARGVPSPPSPLRLPKPRRPRSARIDFPTHADPTPPEPTSQNAINPARTDFPAPPTSSRFHPTLPDFPRLPIPATAHTDCPAHRRPAPLSPLLPASTSPAAPALSRLAPAPPDCPSPAAQPQALSAAAHAIPTFHPTPETSRAFPTTQLNPAHCLPAQAVPTAQPPASQRRSSPPCSHRQPTTALVAPSRGTPTTHALPSLPCPTSLPVPPNPERT
jgi:hypothetical protein